MPLPQIKLEACAESGCVCSGEPLEHYTSCAVFMSSVLEVGLFTWITALCCDWPKRSGYDRPRKLVAFKPAAVSSIFCLLLSLYKSNLKQA